MSCLWNYVGVVKKMFIFNKSTMFNETGSMYEWLNIIIMVVPLGIFPNDFVSIVTIRRRIQNLITHCCHSKLFNKYEMILCLLSGASNLLQHFQILMSWTTHLNRVRVQDLDRKHCSTVSKMTKTFLFFFLDILRTSEVFTCFKYFSYTNSFSD